MAFSFSTRVGLRHRRYFCAPARRDVRPRASAPCSNPPSRIASPRHARACSWAHTLARCKPACGCCVDRANTHRLGLEARSTFEKKVLVIAQSKNSTCTPSQSLYCSTKCAQSHPAAALTHLIHRKADGRCSSLSPHRGNARRASFYATPRRCPTRCGSRKTSPPPYMPAQTARRTCLMRREILAISKLWKSGHASKKFPDSRQLLLAALFFFGPSRLRFFYFASSGY